jgi:hypothetical protein
MRPVWAVGLPRISNDAFYGRSAAPGEPDRLRVARSMARFAAAYLIAGFVAVFLSQAQPLIQLIAGAPVFEEAFKFGLALLLTYWASSIWLRLPVALLIGMAFGFMEHFSSPTYIAEPALAFGFRLAFHGLSCGLSMLCLHVLRSSSRPDLRWASTVTSSLIHYFNNFVVLVVVLAVGPGSDAVQYVIAYTSIALLLVAGIVIASARARFRVLAARLLARVFRDPALRAVVEAEARPPSWAPPTPPTPPAPPAGPGWQWAPPGSR